MSTNYAFRFHKPGHVKSRQFLAAFSHLGQGAILTHDRAFAKLFTSRAEANAWFDRAVRPYVQAPEEMVLVSWRAKCA